MCGVPVHAATAYLQRLIKAGHRVAIAEQTGDACRGQGTRGSKALVSRGIVRVVTAGTLTEEALLDAKSDNWCVAIGEAGGAVALAAADISTGRFVVIDVKADALGPNSPALPPPRWSRPRMPRTPMPRRRCGPPRPSTAAAARIG